MLSVNVSVTNIWMLKKLHFFICLRQTEWWLSSHISGLAGKHTSVTLGGLSHLPWDHTNFPRASLKRFLVGDPCVPLTKPSWPCQGEELCSWSPLHYHHKRSLDLHHSSSTWGPRHPSTVLSQGLATSGALCGNSMQVTAFIRLSFPGSSMQLPPQISHFLPFQSMEPPSSLIVQFSISTSL